MSNRAGGLWRDALLLALLGLLPLLAALRGAKGPFEVRLNLGPGDGPYALGFARDHEVNKGVGTHWSSNDSSLDLPLVLESERLEVAYRYARVLPETAEVRVELAGRPLDSFRCRGGIFEQRSAVTTAAPGTPARLRFRVDSHDPRNLGLNLDWVRFASGGAGRVRLAGFALLHPALLVALLALLMRLAGWGRAAAVALVAPWAIVAAWGLLRDPWLVHRLASGLPEALAALGAALVLIGRWLLARSRVTALDLRYVLALVFTFFLARAAATNHPDFYYPDLMMHARLVEVVRDTGWRFFLAPAHAVDAWAWSKPVLGGRAAMPYAVGFHVLFVPWGFSWDSLLRAEKLVGAAISVLPILAVWVLARTLSVSPLAAALMALVPTYTSRLSFALLPALTGHALDMAFIAFLASRLVRLWEPRTFVAAALSFAACQLSYVSSVTNLSLLVSCLALTTAAEAKPGRRMRTAAALLAAGLAGSVLAVALYYRDFLPAAGALLPRVLGSGAAPASHYPVESWLLLTYARTRDFFDGVYPLLTLFGLGLVLRRGGPARPLAGAWLLTYLLLLLLRAKLPDLFRYGHETLFVTPLVCLLAAESIAWLARRGAGTRVMAGALLVFLALQGLAWQWRAVADQLANAL